MSSVPFWPLVSKFKILAVLHLGSLPKVQNPLHDPPLSLRRVFFKVATMMRFRNVLENHSPITRMSGVQIFSPQAKTSASRIIKVASVGELSEHLGRSVKVSRLTLRGLVDKGFLDWHGSNPRDPS